MLDGKANKYMSGGNAQRENFGKSKGGKAEPEPKTKSLPAQDNGDGATTTITHHPDGSHTAVHSDGETSEHPHIGHLAMHLHGKHADGEAAHVHKHMDGVTSHHIGMDGQVQGPHEHGTVDEAADHMKQMLGEDGGNGAMEEAGGGATNAPHGMPTLY